MKPEMDRRHFLGMGAAAGVAVVAGQRIFAQAAHAPAQAAQQTDPGSVPINTTKLAESLYLLQGAGGNMVLQTGADGNLLIDSSFAPAVPRIRAAIAAVAPTAAGGLLINTHWHGDHTGGNEGMHEAGFAIVAHRATRERLSTLPTICLDQSLTIWRNGDSIELAHFEPAHTDTDISIRFLKADVLHVGDVWFNGGYPFIDEGANGTISGMIRACDKALGLASASTKIVPGHGPLGTKAELQKYREMLAAVRDKVAALKASGLSEADAVAKKPTAEFDDAVGKGFMNGEMFAGIVYRTL